MKINHPIISGFLCLAFGIVWAPNSFSGPIGEVSAKTIESEFSARQAAFLVRGLAIGQISSTGKKTESLLGDAVLNTDRFEIGSITKSFTGICAAELSLEKDSAGHFKLDLEAPISNYLPELSGTFIGTVSARQLGNHLARLPNGYPDVPSKIAEHYQESDILNFLIHYIPNPEEYPSGVRQYSNIGFDTLGILLSRIEKKTFPEIVTARILSPFGMTDTGFITSKLAPKGLLTGYDVNLEVAQYTSESEAIIASGGIISNLRDMLIYLEKNIHPDDSLIGRAIDLSHTLGLGWDSQPGTLPTQKNGGMPGFSSYIQFDSTPGVESGFIVLNNSINSGVTMGLGKILSGEPDTELLREEWLPQDPELIASVSGMYRFSDGSGFLKIEEKNSHYLGARIYVDYGKPNEESEGLKLFTYQNPDLLLVDSGAEVGDAIKILRSGDSKLPQLTYFQAKVSVSGEVTYEKMPLIRSKGP